MHAYDRAAHALGDDDCRSELLALMGTGSPSSLRVSKSTPASNNTSRAAGFLPPAGLYASPIPPPLVCIVARLPTRTEAPGPHAGALPTPAPIDTRKADVSALP